MNATPMDENSNSAHDEKPHLSISAHVVVQLGEELVTDVEQALLELAKNAYDADSEECRIRIDPEWQISPADPQYQLFASRDEMEMGPEPPGDLRVGRIEIRDYGTGIAGKDVESGWLRISSSLKRSAQGQPKKKTPKGRTPVGDKGLGRLATMKLGRVLRMKTAMHGESIWRTVSFSWDHFTQDRTLDQVEVFSGVDETSKVDRPGTIIEILGLSNASEWTNPIHIEKRLVPNLSSLVNPFDIADKFEITIESDRRAHELHSLSEEVLNLASAKFEFDWSGDELKQVSYIAPSLFRGAKGEAAHSKFNELFGPNVRSRLITWLKSDRKLVDRGISFDVEAPWLCKFTDSLPGNPFPSDRAYPGAKDPGPFHARLHYFLFSDATKDKLSQANISAATLQAMSQVAIYRDGFRVRANRDWLHLAEGTTKGSSFYGLRPNNVIGHFSVTNELNPGLVEKSDREGFVDNEALRGFMALGLRSRDYANGSLEAIRASVNKFINSQTLGPPIKERKELARSIAAFRDKTEKTLERIGGELEETQKALANLHLESAVEDSDTPQAIASTLSATIEKARGALRDVNLEVGRQATTSLAIADMGDEDREYANRLLDAAAVGLAARSLAHELHQFVRLFRDGIDRISEENKSIKNSIIASAAKSLASATRELGKIVATIDPMLPGSRSIKESISLSKFLEDYISARRSTAEKAGVQLILGGADATAGLLVRFSRSRLLQVVENLFQNSLYWLKAGPLPNKQVRRIDVKLTPNGFSWHDTGPGIRPSLEASIFDPYVSDKPSSEGSGLGLHIVSTFLEMERSTIQVVGERNSLGRRSTFEVDLTGATEAQRTLSL